MRESEEQPETIRPKWDAVSVVAWFAPPILALVILKWWVLLAILGMALMAGIVSALASRHETDPESDSEK